MARIRHIAMLANDTEQLASFYKTTFGMVEVHRQQPTPEGAPIFLSDGETNVAILPAKGRREGLFHFGFHVADKAATAAQAAAAGAQRGPEQVPRDGRFAEEFILDPVGTRVDLSEAGWAVAPPEAAAARA